MKNSKIIITLLLIGTCMQARSQSPGYLGKKLSLEYNFNTFPLIFLKEITHKTVSFSAIHQGEMAYALGRRFALATHYSYSSSNINLFEYPDGVLTKMNAKFIGFDLQFYRSNYVAPVGVFFNVGYSAGTFTLKEDVKIEVTSYELPDPVYTKVFQPRKYTSHRLRFGVNQKKIIAGNVYISSGLLANLVFGGDVIHSGEYQGIEDLESAKYKGLGVYEMSEKIIWDHLFHFKLGAGVILL